MTSYKKHICVITPNYPYPEFIERGAFVERLVRNWEGHGVNVDVVAPRSVSNLMRSGLKGSKVEYSIAGNHIVYPTYLSFSNRKVGPVNLMEWTRTLFDRSALRGMSGLPVPDLFYGQFLMTGGSAAVRAGKRYDRPAFADIGESVFIEEMDKNERREASEIVRGLDGIITVSENLAEQVIEIGADPDRVFVCPNTVDLTRFYPRDKSDCRKKLQLPEDIKIVIFVGHFIERKGPLRVLNAIEKFSGRAKGVFLGRGKQTPEGPNVLHAGPVSNEDVPLWLSAGDMFVLPTFHEGHCNAINEAMACGLPVISSDIPEINIQIPPGTGLLVNPGNVEELSSAIETYLADSDLMESMGKRALEIQRERSSESRELQIYTWLESMIGG